MYIYKCLLTKLVTSIKIKHACNIIQILSTLHNERQMYYIQHI